MDSMPMTYAVKALYLVLMLSMPPIIVASVVGIVLSLIQAITQLQEQVSIRDLRSILEALIEWSAKEKDTVMLTEYVRSALKRQISYMHSRGQNMLPAILLDPGVEETIRKAVRQTSAGAFLALEPAVTERFMKAVADAAGPYAQQTQKPVIMTSMDIRRYVRRLIEGDHYTLAVMSYQELTPEISVQPVNRIRL